MSLRFSDYLAFSQAVFQNKFQLLYSTRTASSVLLNTRTIADIRNHRWEKITEDTLEQLKLQEILVDETPREELLNILKRNQDEIDKRETLHFVVQPSAMCQLGCHYCGQKHEKKTMDKNIGEEIYERLERKIKENPSFKKLSIGWFGAEPLLGLSEIRRLAPKFIELSKKYGLSYTSKIVTNGLSLKPNIFNDLVNKYKVETFEITLDGTKEYHDKRRFTKSGLDSFELIFQNIVDICSADNFDKNHSCIIVRCNVDKENHQGVDELIELIKSKNIHQKIQFYVAPIHSWGNDAHLQSLEQQEFADNEIRWIDKLTQKGYDVSYLPNNLKKITCMAVSRDAEIVDAYGNIFNCSEIPYVDVYKNKEEYHLSHILNPKNEEKRMYQDWFDAISNDQFPCTSCKILPICGGQCPKAWHESNPPCPTIKYNIEDRMMRFLEKNYQKIINP